MTTSAQTGGTTYTVTVANTVTDTLSAAVSGTANTAQFNGYEVLAVLRINPDVLPRAETTSCRMN